jgi:hypothetical protein
VANFMAIKPANKAVASHPAMKPANIIGDVFFIVLDSPGRGWKLPERPFQRLRYVNQGKSYSWSLLGIALRLKSRQHGRVGSSSRGSSHGGSGNSRRAAASAAATITTTAAAAATAAETVVKTAGTVIKTAPPRASTTAEW